MYFTKVMLVLVLCRFSEKNRVISPFSASDWSFKTYFGQNKVINFGMETNEGFVITPVLISFLEGSGKTSYKGFKKVRYFPPPINSQC